MRITKKSGRNKQSKRQRNKEPRPGVRCPICGEGTLVYDACLQLVCPHCHQIYRGAFT